MTTEDSPDQPLGDPEDSPIVRNEAEIRRRHAQIRTQPDWCGAAFHTPVLADDRPIAEARRMCGLKEPHEWHQDRLDPTFRWKALPPLAMRQNDSSPADKFPAKTYPGHSRQRTETDGA